MDGMHDLETIARLEYAKAVEKIAREAQIKLQSVLTGMPRGGQMEAAKLKIQLDQREESCRAYAQIWQDLLEAKNGGNLTRADVDFIITKLLDLTAAQKASMLGSPNAPRLASAATEAGIRMDGLVGSLRRDLEIRIRRQQAFPAGNSKTITTDDYRFAKLALDEARKSIAEADDRPHPKVGAIVVKDCQVLSVAHRGEVLGNHAEFVALEKKFADGSVVGATVYTTLEPCTTRNHPKVPCAERLVERHVARVVIGMLDPDERITGRGVQRLREADIRIDFFPHDLMKEVEELNREFTRHCKQQVGNLKGPLASPISELVGEIESARFTVRGESTSFGKRTPWSNVSVTLRVTNRKNIEITIKRATLQVTVNGQTYLGTKTELWHLKDGPDLLNKITNKSPIRHGPATVGALEFFVEGLRCPQDGVLLADVSVTLIDEFDVSHVIRNKELRIAG